MKCEKCGGIKFFNGFSGKQCAKCFAPYIAGGARDLLNRFVKK